MSDTTTATTDRVTSAPERAVSTIFHGVHRVWRAGLGLIVIAGEQTQSALNALEDKGQRLEPSLAVPFKRAGGAAKGMMSVAGESVKQIGTTVGGAVPALPGSYRRLSDTDFKELVGRVVDEKLEPVLQRLEQLEEKEEKPARRRKDTE